MTTIAQIAGRWDYIQGGFTYIDANNKSDAALNTTQLSTSELRGFISSLSCPDDSVKDEIIDKLGLDAPAIGFDVLPKSFLIMLDCDNEYLQSAPETPLNSEFGSVAIAMLYREVTEWCGSQSQVPENMLQTITNKTGRQPITEQ